MAGIDGVEDFLAALKSEILLRRDPFGSASYETIFLGGGTPSLLTPRQIEAILVCLHARFRIASGAEITIEANPGTVTRESLIAFRSMGVNRLSVGVQSFHDHELAFLGRVHDRAEALRCLDWGRAAGFENIGLDLIYSIPDQTLEEWDENLRAAVDFAPQHIAAYSLIVEERTPLAWMVEAGSVHRNLADREAAMYERTMELLAAHGYEHYEVSNYALPEFRCRHNCAYWSHEDYLGFGPSAHSFWKPSEPRRGRRWWNVADLSAYGDRLARGLLPIASEEHVGPRELVQERILLGLRSDGLDLARLAVELGYDLAQRQDSMMRWMIEEGLAAMDGQVLRLTSKGYMLCDEISARLSRDVSFSLLPTDRAAPLFP
ncbi:MAG: oxygen-independent coproporphyrinogen oxidase [candidate division NC10 bacterium]|nr:oxygen-independent coproporphyrinogen oxidase [candidate division NC10 bacterium]